MMNALQDALLPGGTSVKLFVLQFCQICIAITTFSISIRNLVVPSENKAFTFSLLYTLILTSITNTFILRKERNRASKGKLTKYKYIKYQLCKLIAAIAWAVVGWFGFLATPEGSDKLIEGQSGSVMNGYRVNDLHSRIMWLGVYNWVFLWVGLLYSFLRTGPKDENAQSVNGQEQTS